MSDALDLLLEQQASSGSASTFTPAAPRPGPRPIIPGQNEPAAPSVDDLLRAQAGTPSGPDPTEGMSLLDKMRAGAGMGMAKVARAVGQAGGMALDAVAPQELSLTDLLLNRKPIPLSAKLGFPTQDSIDEANRRDAALAATTPGKVGNVIGQIGATLPAVLIPGANTYLGAAATGGLVGGLTTEGNAEQRLRGAEWGAAGGTLAKGLGDVGGQAFDALAARRAAAQTANAGRDAAGAAAQGAGYVIPPADIAPSSLTNQLLNGLSGKIKTAQSASAQNQPVTNALAKQAIGAPADQALSVDALNAIRNQAGKAYEAVGATGTIQPGQAYSDALDAIAAPFAKAAQGFPNGTPSPVIAQIDALRSPAFDAASAVAKISELRSSADAAYRAGNKDVGAALKSGASALEDAIDQHLTDIGAPAGLLDGFRNARQLIAKTYAVQKALNDTTGDVSAKVLAAQLAKGKPLTGELRTIAEANATFPKALQTLTGDPQMYSPLDYGAVLATAASGHPYAAAGMAGRPLVRSLILSRPYQDLMTTPSYGTGNGEALLRALLTSQLSQRLAPTMGGLTAARLAPQPAQ